MLKTGMVCEICQKRSVVGYDIQTCAIDVSAGFGEPPGRVFFAINHCGDARECRAEARRKVDEFADKWEVRKF